MEIKVLSYNIHKGLNQLNTQVTLDLIRESIRTVGADIVFLQEVVGEKINCPTNDVIGSKENQFEFLADEVWPYFSYAKNAIYKEGHHGNVILSKYPINQWAKHDISTNRFEQRGVLYCEVELPKEVTGLKENLSLHTFCVHLNLLHSGRKKQYSAIKDLIQKYVVDDDAILLAGDFNDWNKQSSRTFEKELDLIEVHKYLNDEYAKTFPSNFPFLSLDRIYYRHLCPIKCQGLSGPLWTNLSDHIPLFSEFKLHGK